jgi:galactofuranosylgalactofuranosylrhamnosyl-N-acetylglucosaminyl-diphospho-decaprenol beta-1,5/1,6-galactofuranosyltransferase
MVNFTIHNIRLAFLPKNLHLYANSLNVILDDSGSRWKIAPHGLVQFSGYYSLLFPYNYKKYSQQGKIYLEFTAKGEGQFLLKCESDKYFLRREIQKISISSQEFQKFRVEVCDLESPIKPSDVFYPEFSTQESELQIQNIFYTLETETNLHDVHLGICICTFQREQYVKKNISELFSNSHIQNQFTVFISDNAGTLELDNPNPAIQLFQNPNYGGSGGFAFTQMKAFEDPKVTHILFMDDDVELDSEVIFRLIQLYKLIGKQKICISGGMIDLFNNFQMYETGAKYIPKKFRYKPMNHKKLLTSPSSITKIVNRSAKLEYGGFWFFAMPKVGDYGLLLPFFIRADDLEYNYRLLENGFQVIYQPGISIQHEPFYAKDPEWIQYYFWRNNLIFNSLRFKSYFWGFWKSFYIVALKNLFFFKYKPIEFSLEGVKDYLRGPRFLQNIRPDEFHKTLLEQSKIDLDKKTQPFQDFLLNEVNHSIWHILKCFLSWNGNLFPVSSKSQSHTNLSLKVGNLEFLKKYSGFESITVQNDSGNYAVTYHINRKRFRKIIFRSLGLFLKSIFLWIPVSLQWKKAEKILTSQEFWLKYWEKAR